MSVNLPCLILLHVKKNRVIVDSKAEITTDNVISMMEIYELGKIKLIDTTGIDKTGELHKKKREKTKQAILESNIFCLY